MKGLKFLVLGLFGMFFTLNVNALDVDTLADLKTCLAGTEETCTVKSELVLTTGSETLALNGKNVVLEKTITVSGEASLTISGEGKVEGTVSTGLINVKAGGTVTVNGGSFKNTAKGAKCFGVYGTATDTDVKTTLTIADGVSLSSNYGITVGEASSGAKASYGAVVNFSGNFNGLTGNNGWTYGSAGININGSLKPTTGNVPVINVTGGSITTVEGTSGIINDDDAPAVYAAGYVKWNISGGAFKGSEALSIKAGEFNITGGTFEAFGAKATPEAYGNGSEATGAAISVTANTGYAKNVTLKIENATVESKNAAALFEGKSNANETAIKEMTISGGEFTGKDVALDVENVKGFVTGGVYSSDLDEEYLSKDLVTKEDEDGNYLVGAEHEISVVEGENGEVVADKEKAIVGEFVTITTTPSEGYELDEVVVKVVGSNSNETVTVTDGKFEMPDADVEISATFKEVEKEPAGDTEDSGAGDVEEPSTDNNENSDTEDTEDSSTADVENPSTGDNIMLYAILGLVSLAGLTIVIKKRSFN